MVTLPAAFPAVTLTETWPCVFEVPVVVLREADPPSTEKVTARLETGLLFPSFSWKTTGAGNGWFNSAFCPPP